MANESSIVRFRGKIRMHLPLVAFAFLVLTAAAGPACSQQFNSGSWSLLTHGVGTASATVGEQYHSVSLGFGFVPNWEGDLGITLYDETDDAGTSAHYSTSVYVKRLIYENRAKTGGVAVMAGIGQSPSYLAAGVNTDDFRSYWAVLPVTFVFIESAISWDLMPGVLFDRKYGIHEKSAWGFSYSSRVAIRKVIPRSAILGEIFGAEGDAKADAQFKAGVRWESKYVLIALTYGDGLEGNDGAGVELGFSFYTPPYF